MKRHALGMNVEEGSQRRCTQASLGGYSFIFHLLILGSNSVRRDGGGTDSFSGRRTIGLQYLNFGRR